MFLRKRPLHWKEEYPQKFLEAPLRLPVLLSVETAQKLNTENTSRYHHQHLILNRHCLQNIELSVSIKSSCIERRGNLVTESFDGELGWSDQQLQRERN